MPKSGNISQAMHMMSRPQSFDRAQPAARRLMIRILFLMISVGIAPALAAFGQNLTGQISGVVKDTSGAVIPNATVVVTNTNQNLVVRTLKTGTRGQYTVPLLAVGQYSIKNADNQRYRGEC